MIGPVYTVLPDQLPHPDHGGSMIGREAQLKRIQTHWQEAVSGQGNIVDLVGVAGIGKSRLVHTFCDMLPAEGYDCLMSSCHSYDQASPYALLSQVIQGLAQISPTEHEQTQREKLISLVEQLNLIADGLIAGLLGRLFGADEAHIVKRLAHHYYHSDERVKAIRYCLRMAQQSADAWSNDTAIIWYERALEKIKSFEQTPATTTEQEQGATPAQLMQWQIERLVGQSDTLSVMGSNDEAIVGYTQTLNLMSDPQTFPPSPAD